MPIQRPSGNLWQLTKSTKRQFFSVEYGWCIWGSQWMAESVLKVRRHGSQVWLSCLVVIGPSPWGVSLKYPFAKNDPGECHCVILFLSVQACWSPKWVVWSLMCILPSYPLIPSFQDSGWLKSYFWPEMLWLLPFPSVLNSLPFSLLISILSSKFLLMLPYSHKTLQYSLSH